MMGQVYVNIAISVVAAAIAGPVTRGAVLWYLEPRTIMLDESKIRVSIEAALAELDSGVIGGSDLGAGVVVDDGPLHQPKPDKPLEDEHSWDLPPPLRGPDPNCRRYDIFNGSTQPAHVDLTATWCLGPENVIEVNTYHDPQRSALLACGATLSGTAVREGGIHGRPLRAGRGDKRTILPEGETFRIHVFGYRNEGGADAINDQVVLLPPEQGRLIVDIICF